MWDGLVQAVNNQMNCTTNCYRDKNAYLAAFLQSLTYHLRTVHSFICISCYQGDYLGVDWCVLFWILSVRLSSSKVGLLSLTSRTFTVKVRVVLWVGVPLSSTVKHQCIGVLRLSIKCFSQGNISTCNIDFQKVPSLGLTKRTIWFHRFGWHHHRRPRLSGWSHLPVDPLISQWEVEGGPHVVGYHLHQSL